MLKRLILGSLLMTSLAFGAQPAMAINLTTGLPEAAGDAGYDTNQELPVLVGKIIKVIIAFLGVIFLVLTIYAGITWMTAAGEEKQIAKAKGILTASVIGLVIVLAAYSITTFIVANIEYATTGSFDGQAL